MRRAAASAVRAAVGPVIEQLELRTLLAAGTVGPDGYGYVAEAATFQNAHLVADTAGVHSDFDAIDLGAATLNVYGHSYTGSGQIFPNQQGLITFGSGSNSGNNGGLSGAPFQRAVAPMWGLGYGTVLWKLEDTAGSSAPDRLVVQYISSFVEYQAIFQLNTGGTPGDIVFNYVDIETDQYNGNTADARSSIGIKDAGYTATHLLISANKTGSPLIGSGKAIRIHNVKAGQPHAIPGPPKTVDEGPAAQVALDGTRSTGADLSYAWDFDTDGIYGETGADATNGNETGAKPTFRGDNGLDGDNTYPIVLRVTDSAGVSSYEETSVTVNDVLSTVTATGPATATVGLPVSYTVSGADVVATDLRGVSIDWGDNDYAINERTSSVNDTYAGTDTFTHTYNTPGTYELTFYSYEWQGGNSLPLKKSITVAIGPDVQLADGRLLINGTAGADTIALDSPSGNVRLNRNGAVTTYPLADVTGISIYSVAGDDQITISSLDLPTLILSGDGDDTVTTAAGADSIRGGAGADSIATNAGNDSIDGGDGNDTLAGGDGNDNAYAGEGDNVINTGAGDDTTGTGEGKDSIDGGTGIESVFDRGGNNFIRADAGSISSGNGNDTIVAGLGGASVSIQSGGGNDSVTTGAGDDSISCDAGDPTISSGDGNDSIFCSSQGTSVEGATVDAGRGDDSVLAWTAKSIFAGAGEDRVTVRKGALVDGGAGNDVISAGYLDFDEESFVTSVLGGDGNDFISAARAALVDAGDGNDTVHAGCDATFEGGAVGASVLGGNGDDNIYSGDGPDTLSAGAGRDTVHAGNNSDLISGGGGNDKLFGQGGKDRLYGGAGSDRLYGQGGNDRLIAGPSNDNTPDTLAGGDGTDSADRSDELDQLLEVENNAI